MPTEITTMKHMAIFIPLFLIVTFALPATAAPPRTLKELVKYGTKEGTPDGCPGHLVTVHGTDRDSVERTLRKEILEFRTLAEQALALRAETIKVGKRMKEKMEQGKPLSG